MDNMFLHSDCYDLNGVPVGTGMGGQNGNIPNMAINCAIILATSGQYRSVADAQADTNNFDPLLNNAPASLVGGLVMAINQAGEYNYMNTRNNNFSNRSQKGTFIVA